MSKPRVLVLMGGVSAEREVSLVSGAAVSEALTSAGYPVVQHDVGDDIGTLLGACSSDVDVVFNALHGRFGEDGCIQGLLNLLGMPYTHSGLLASAMAMHKPTAKRLFADAGLPVAEHVLVTPEEVAAGDPLPRPYVVKPIDEGSSVGVRIVHPGADAPDADDALWAGHREVMVERFIAGREFTVAVMGDHPLAVTEITTHRGFYDYDAKYAAGGSVHVIPADLSDEDAAQVLDLALRAHDALGCRGVSRADFRFDGERFFILEVNTQPGMTPTSLVPEQARHVGISFEDLVSWMVENAACDA